MKSRILNFLLKLIDSCMVSCVVSLFKLNIFIANEVQCIQANIKYTANSSCKSVTIAKCFPESDHGIVGKEADNSLFYVLLSTLIKINCKVIRQPKTTSIAVRIDNFCTSLNFPKQWLRFSYYFPKFSGGYTKMSLNACVNLPTSN